MNIFLKWFAVALLGGIALLALSYQNLPLSARGVHSGGHGSGGPIPPTPAHTYLIAEGSPIPASCCGYGDRLDISMQGGHDAHSAHPAWVRRCLDMGGEPILYPPDYPEIYTRGTLACEDVDF